MNNPEASNLAGAMNQIAAAIARCAPASCSTARGIAKDLEKTMQCNCDLDNWQPEDSTGHSWVCNIHKLATRIFECRKPSNDQDQVPNPLPDTNAMSTLFPYAKAKGARITCIALFGGTD